MIKPGWPVNGVFAVIALVLIAVDVKHRSDAIGQNHAQIPPMLAHK